MLQTKSIAGKFPNKSETQNIHQTRVFHIFPIPLFLVKFSLFTVGYNDSRKCGKAKFSHLFSHFHSIFCIFLVIKWHMEKDNRPNYIFPHFSFDYKWQFSFYFPLFLYLQWFKFSTSRTLWTISTTFPL